MAARLVVLELGDLLALGRGGVRLNTVAVY